MKNNESSNHKNRKSLSKAVILFIATAFVLMLAIGGTVAFITTSTSSKNNQFLPAKVSCQVVENISGNSKTSVTIKNTGNVEEFIRCAVIANTIDSNGNVTGTYDVSGYLCGTGWTEGSDGFFYYSQAVEAGAQTNNLLTASIDLTGIQVAILADAIQTEPSDVAENAWGITSSAN